MQRYQRALQRFKISVPTNDVTTDDMDGVVEATLVARVGYNVAADVTPGYVDVLDQDGNDPVTAEVIAPAGDVTEGETLRFRINRAPQGAELTVHYDIMTTGNAVVTSPSTFDRFESSYPGRTMVGLKFRWY